MELSHQRGERTPWAKTVGTCNKLLSVADGLWTYLTIKGIEPTYNAAEHALRQSLIQRKISHGVQSRQGAICRSRLAVKGPSCSRLRAMNHPSAGMSGTFAISIS